MVTPPRSKGYAKQKKIIDRLEAKQRRLRIHNIHKTTNWLTNTYENIYIRDNNVKDMMQNERTAIKHKLESGEITDAEARATRETLRAFERNLHRALADSSFFEFQRQLRYKCDWRDRFILEVDSDVPTTQTCSICKTINPALAGIQGLSIREWDCPVCSTHHDREANSATNRLHWAHNTLTKQSVS